MSPTRAARQMWVFVLCTALSTLSASAQTLPTDPIVFGDGIVTLGGSLAAAIGPDDPGFYNYTDYTYSSLRNVRASLTSRVQTGNHLAFLGEFRVQNGASPEIFALYMRVRPWTAHDVDIEVGRVPPTFGAFQQRGYAYDNLLIGYPLGYQYLSSLRPDSLPATANELLVMRGRGWRSVFSVGDTTPYHGVPLATAYRWDTGVRAHAATGVIEGTGAVTIGTISNPLFWEDNNGVQFAGRIALHPLAGLVIGASLSNGPFVTTEAAQASGTIGGNSLTQKAWGADIEYSASYYLLRAELIQTGWTLPVISAPFIAQPLNAGSVSVEGRYKILPGLYAAARVDQLQFSDVTGSTATRPWDAPVTRVEVGGGYSLQRNLLLKIAYQYDRRDDTRVPRAHFVSAEVVFWL